MESDHTSPQLSFDALGLVFSHYVDGETVEHPLETLLLVCRAWNDAALGHRTLWTNFRICMGHGFTSRIWLRRLTKRLERSGTSSSLDIDIRNPPEDSGPLSDGNVAGDTKGTWKWAPCRHENLMANVTALNQLVDVHVRHCKY